MKTMFVSLCDRSIERGMERMYNAQAGRRRVQLTAKSRGGGTRRDEEGRGGRVDGWMIALEDDHRNIDVWLTYRSNS